MRLSDLKESFMYNDKSYIIKWMKHVARIGVNRYTINEDLSVDVNGDANLSRKRILHLPVKFRNVTGSFDITGNYIDTLENMPDSIGKDLLIGANNFTSLVGCPQKVNGTFACTNNKFLTTLEGGPQQVSGDFFANYTAITSLEGGPQQVGGNYFVAECKKLKSLKGSPRQIYGTFRCDGPNLLTSLDGGPQEVADDFVATSCRKLITLKGAPRSVGRSFYAEDCGITSLVGGPQDVGSSYKISRNEKLTTLKGAPKYIDGAFEVCATPSLRSLEHMPREITAGLTYDGPEIAGKIPSYVRIGGIIRTLGKPFDPIPREEAY